MAGEDGSSTASSATSVGVRDGSVESDRPQTAAEAPPSGPAWGKDGAAEQPRKQDNASFTEAGGKLRNSVSFREASETLAAIEKEPEMAEPQPQELAQTHGGGVGRRPPAVTGSPKAVSPKAVRNSPTAVTGSPKAVRNSPTAVTGSPKAVSPKAVRNSPTAVTESPKAVSPKAVHNSPTAVTGSPKAVSPKAVRNSPTAVTGSPKAVRNSPMERLHSEDSGGLAAFAHLPSFAMSFYGDIEDEEDEEECDFGIGVCSRAHGSGPALRCSRVEPSRPSREDGEVAGSHPPPPPDQAVRGGRHGQKLHSGFPPPPPRQGDARGSADARSSADACLL